MARMRSGQAQLKSPPRRASHRLALRGGAAFWTYVVGCLVLVGLQVELARRILRRRAGGADVGADAAAEGMGGAAPPWASAFPDLAPECAAIRRIAVVGERHTGESGQGWVGATTRALSPMPALDHHRASLPACPPTRRHQPGCKAAAPKSGLER